MNALARVSDGWNRMATRDRRALTLGALLILPLLLVVGVVRPYLTMVEQSRSELEAERALLAREEGLIASADELPASLEAATLRLERESAGLIPAANELLAEASFSDILQSAAIESRVLVQEIRGVESDPADALAGLAPIRLAMRAESNLEGVATFLTRLEGDNLLIRILEISVEPIQAGSRQSGDGPSPTDMGALSISLVAEAFWTATATESMVSTDIVDTRLSGIPP